MVKTKKGYIAYFLFGLSGLFVITSFFMDWKTAGVMFFAWFIYNVSESLRDSC